ncbi:MAG: lipoprotein-releasing ABC transporter permease subunit [Alphaproteobacteria bacterium]
MFSAFERTIAWRYLRSPRQDGFISVIAGFSFAGIMLGVATLIVVMSVMNGFRHEFLNHIVGMNGHLWIYQKEGPLPNYQQLQKDIEALDGVKFALPTIERQSILISRNQARGVSIHGLSLDDMQRLPLVASNIRAGSLTPWEGNKVLMGLRLAERLNVRLGERISLMTPDGTPTAFGTLPRQRSFEIGGFFEVGMSQYDQSVIFMPLATAQDFFNVTDGVTTLEITLQSAELSDSFAQKLQQLYPNLAMMDWKTANGNIMQAAQVERNVMFLILTLIILIAAFNIISGLIMLVKDKTRDIAIMRTMGATQSSILKIFFLTGATIGTVGTALGSLLALLFVANIESIRRFLESLTGTNLFNDEIYFLSRLPVKIDSVEVVEVIVLALVLSLLATLYPSWRASRLDPVEALRQ